MKRKLHPHRRHGRRHVSAQTRYEWMCEFIILSKRKSEEVGVKVATSRQRSVDPFPAFPRARRAARKRITLPRLVAAGYTFASLERTADWAEVHAWLQARCTHKFGRTCTWFGGTFVFENAEDREAFVARFSCAEGYKPMFAFETGG